MWERPHGIADSNQFYLSVRNVPKIALDQEFTSVSFGENRRSESIIERRLPFTDSDELASPASSD